MRTTTVITLTVHGDADLEHTAAELARVVARTTVLPVEYVVERGKHVGPFWATRVVQEGTV
jgi:hypothetical protein